MKHKISPQLDSEIRILAATLPEILACDKNGRVLYNLVHKKVFYKDLLPHEKKEIRWPKPHVLYQVIRNVPRRENHYTNLINEYQKKGHQGLTDYVDGINQVTELSKSAGLNVEAQQNGEVQPV
jgi:hypothetical protein